MKRLLIAVAVVLLAAATFAKDFSFIWENSAENAPGAVEGYQLRWGSVGADPATFTQTNDIPGEANVTGTVNLPPGQYWIAVYAYATRNNVRLYSEPSNVLEIVSLAEPVTLRLRVP